MKKSKFQKATEAMSDDVAEYWEEFFNKVDMDKDGVVSRRELTNYYTKGEVVSMYEDINQMPPSKEDIDMAFERLGKGKKETLSLEEFKEIKFEVKQKIDEIQDMQKRMLQADRE